MHMTIMWKISTVVAVLCTVDVVSSATSDDPFTAWKEAHGKTYDSELEELRRRAIWQEKMDDMARLRKNADQRGYSVELNSLADRHIEELLAKPVINKKSGLGDFNMSSYTARAPIPESVDWRKHGVVTPVRNEGAAGAGNVFAFLDVLESQHAIQTGHLEIASYAELVACCSAEIHLLADLYSCVHKLGGLCTNSSYRPVPGKCNSESCTPVFIFKKVGVVPRGNEELLASAVVHEPVMVGIDASDHAFMLYREGVFSDPDCKQDELDHAMLLVGYGQTSEGKKYWILKNSWGSEWGMEGYMLLARDAGNMCGVATLATYPE